MIQCFLILMIFSIVDFDNAHQILYDKVDLAPNIPKGCHIYTGPKKPTGRKKVINYGRVQINNKRYYVHILSVMIHLRINVIPRGKVVSHRCHTSLCVNPEHLSLETIKLNNQRKAFSNANECSGHGRLHKKCIL